jgi:hypothetical protein
LSEKLVPTFADRGCYVVSVTDPHGRILWFLEMSRYFFFQVAPQLYSRGWMDPVPDPRLLRESGRAGNRPRASRSVARRRSRKRKICAQFVPQTRGWTETTETHIKPKLHQTCQDNPSFRNYMFSFRRWNCPQRKEFQDAEDVRTKGRRPNWMLSLWRTLPTVHKKRFYF